MEAPKQLDYVRFGTVFSQLQSFKCIKIAGSDATTFLNKQLTSKIDSLHEKNFHQSCILDIKGRLVSNFLVLKESKDTFYILIQEQFVEDTINRLNLFLVSEDVECEITNFTFYAIWGLVLNHKNGFLGKWFNENCFLTMSKPIDLEEVVLKDLELLEFCSGEPRLGHEVHPGDLVTNTFLVETCIASQKGCYPGQETVNKVLSHKGAGLYPVCLVSNSDYTNDSIVVNGKSVGKILRRQKIDQKYFFYTMINREFRVLGMKIDLNHIQFEVHYFPLFKNDLNNKASELYFKGVDEFQRGHDQEAVRLFELAIELNPNFEDAYESLGVLCGRLGDYFKAIDLMKKLEKVNPMSIMAHTNLSLYYMKIGNIKDAEEHKSLATVKQFEKLGIDAQLKRDAEQKRLRDQQEILRKEGMFKQVLEIDDDDSLANYGMAEIEFQRGEFLKAQRYIEKTLKSDPKYSVAYLLLAKIFRASGNDQAFLDTVKKGIEISTKNGDLMPANEMQSMLNNR